MDLSKLSIEPRQRNGWQAIDLGFVMARRWWWPCFLAWAIPSFLVFCLLSIVFYQQPWLAFVITWWLKPLWDRLPLFVASRLLFGESPRTGALLRNFIPLAKTDLLASLTYRRFSLSRSFDLPVIILEGLRKNDRRQRLAVLHQGHGGAAAMLTLVGVHVEAFVSLGLFTGVLWLLPEQLWVDHAVFMFSESLVVEHAANLITWMSMALVAPFYCVAGFSLYINRRIDLEGWDIEVRFRHLLTRYERYEGGKKTGGIAACVLPFLMTVLMLVPDCGWANDEAGAESLVVDYYQQLGADAADSKAKITEVLSGADFFQMETERGWRVKQKDAAEKEDWSLFDLFDRWYQVSAPLRKALKNFAGFFELGGWLLLVGLVAWVLVKYRAGLATVMHLRRGLSVAKAEPELLFGLDVREESLPDDVCREVEQLWESGDERQAVALLYRATLSLLIHHHAFEFYAGFTEQECLAVVAERKDEPLSAYLARLTFVWQRLAYAHQFPEREQVAQLCAGWRNLFAEVQHGA